MGGNNYEEKTQCRTCNGTGYVFLRFEIFGHHTAKKHPQRQAYQKIEKKKAV